MNFSTKTSFGALWLSLFVVVSNHDVAQSKAITTDDINIENLPSRNLVHLIELIEHGKSKPSVDLAFEAYKEYLSLHRIQSGLSDSFNAAQKKSDGADGSEQMYARINKILEHPLMKIVNENLFNVIPDSYSRGQSVPGLKQADRLKLAKAIDIISGP